MWHVGRVVGLMVADHLNIKTGDGSHDPTASFWRRPLKSSSSPSTRGTDRAYRVEEFADLHRCQLTITWTAAQITTTTTKTPNAPPMNSWTSIMTGFSGISFT